MEGRTAASVFGAEAVDRLALLAIDLLCACPEKIATGTTRVPASLVEQGREILDDAGVDWRGLIRGAVARRREAEELRLADGWATQAAKYETDHLERLLARLPAQATGQRRAIEAELRRRETFQ